MILKPVNWLTCKSVYKLGFQITGVSKHNGKNVFVWLHTNLLWGHIVRHICFGKGEANIYLELTMAMYLRTLRF